MSTSGTDPWVEQVSGVIAATRKLGIHAAFFMQAVADRVGLASTDVECLEILVEEGRLSTGELATATGLTSGAATRMVDRLENAGFVRRVADPVDRRRVLVEPIPERVAAVQVRFDALSRAIADAVAEQDSAALGSVQAYLETALRVAREETARLRDGAPASGEAGPGDDASFVAPLAGAERGRLVFSSGAPDVELRADPALGDLVRARFVGATPRVRARGGIVTIHYTRFTWLDWRAKIGDSRLQISAHWRRDKSTIVLNGSIPWDIELRGGASAIDGDLSAARLASLAASGGASKVSLRLPAPQGIVPIHVSGGMSDLTLVRPVGTAARLRVRGGASRITLDGQRVDGVGSVALATPGADTAESRYEIEIDGGASKVTVSAAPR